MSLVGGYSTGAYYAGSIGHDFYPQAGAAATMGVSRYQWHHPHHHSATQVDVTSPAEMTPHPATWMNAHNNVNIHTSHESLQSHLEHNIMGINSADCYPHGYGIAPEYAQMQNMYSVMADGQVKVRVVKRKTSANKKERRRTISINTAFSALRGCIPNVPTDTKLSKIKTLRLATSYIAYLMDVLNKDDPNMTEGFKAELTKKTETTEERRKKEAEEMLRAANKEDKKSKGRTGWPQAVWASELKTEQVASCSSGSSSSGEHDQET